MRSASTGRRAAFTLIELLVVIAIIVILVSLVAVAVFKWIDNTRHHNSEALIKAVQETLKRHWTEVINAARKESVSPAVLNLANGNQELARILWIKVRLTEAFPMTYYEALYPPRYYDHTANTWVDLIPPGQRKNTVYASKVSGIAAPNLETESAACLLIALSVSHGNAAAINLDLLPVPPLDTDGDNVKEIVDGWGNAIAFFRFPTAPITPLPPANANADLQAFNPSPKNSNGNPTIMDPLDSKFQMLNGAWWSSINRFRFQEVCRFTLEKDGGNGFEYYSQPVLVSKGLDGILGLKLLESAGVPLPPVSPAKPPAPNPTMHAVILVPSQFDYPDMQLLDPVTERDNIYSYKLAAPQ